MNSMYIAIPGLIMLIFVLLGMKSLFDDNKKNAFLKKDITEKRKIQNALNRIGNTMSRSAKNKTVYKVESTCAQAGFPISYGTFMIISFSTALILPLLCIFLLNNVLLAVVSCVGGYILPMQTIRYIRNKRLAKLSKQAGSFLNILTERFKATHDLGNCIISAKKDFEGQEPMYSEILKTEGEMKRGMSAIDALMNFSVRVNSVYIKLFCEYYPIIPQIGINETTLDIMCDPFRTYEKQRKKNEALEKRIQANMRDNMVMVYAIPIIMLYQSATNKEYLPFMVETFIGQIGMTVIITTIIVCVWFLFTKLGAPIDDGND